MVVLTRGESKMYSCRVLYIGSAPPIETIEGIEAIQEPLNQRYPSDLSSVEGIDCTVTVLADCLQVNYLESGQIVQFPLNKLKICAAVRSVFVVDGASGEKRRRFVPVNKVECDKDHPAVFCVIIRRSQGRQIQECHSFICNTAHDALHLVNATATANVALKKAEGASESGMQVFQNGYHSDRSGMQTYVQQTTATPREDEIIYIRSSAQQQTETKLEPPPLNTKPLHYAIRQPEATRSKSEDNVIYISFDKTNLIQTEDSDRLQVKPSSASAYLDEEQTTTTLNYRASRQSPLLTREMSAPEPIIVRSPRPPPMAYGPPPPMMMMMPPPPPPPRLYERRFIAPPPRMIMQPPVYARYKGRSSSPTRYAGSEFQMAGVHKEKYQPRWRSHHSDIVGPPPRNFMREGMMLNERAFSHRVNGDSRISRSAVGYQYPTAFDTYYDRPVTKSNPRYSSSESSSSGNTDNRFSKSKR